METMSVSDDFVIRKMKLADIDQVLIVEHEAFTSPWSKSTFEAEVVDNDLATYLVIEQQQQIIGYAGMWLILDEAHVTNVAVLSGYRGEGVGDRLFAALIQTAREIGAVSMTLEVRATNIPAQQLYLKYGFQPYGIRPQYYSDTKEDAIIMWLNQL